MTKTDMPYSTAESAGDLRYAVVTCDLLVLLLWPCRFDWIWFSSKLSEKLCS
jgi:hypothetical protein